MLFIVRNTKHNFGPHPYGLHYKFTLHTINHVNGGIAVPELGMRALGDMLELPLQWWQQSPYEAGTSGPKHDLGEEHPSGAEGLGTAPYPDHDYRNRQQLCSRLA